jgi:molecular chaperone GrpE
MADAKRNPHGNPQQNDNGASAEQQAATAVLDDLEALKARVATAEQERDQFLGLLQRTRADFENYEKRVLRDLAQERRYMHGGLARELLPVLDNLERAIQAAHHAGEQGPLVQGVGMVQGQLLDALKRHGITIIDAVGQPFNPTLHEAVMQQQAPDKTAGTVLQVVERGFKIHDRVLRPAKVIIAAPPA